MTSVKYIGMDVHKETISIAVLNSTGKLLMESIIETKAGTILQFFGGLRGDMHVTFEEGTWTAWLYDLLKAHVSQIVVCNPRKNALLKDGNKSDRIDARKLADLLRGNYLKPVYHGEHGLRMLRELSRTCLTVRPNERWSMDFVSDCVRFVVVLPPSFDLPPSIAETGQPVRVQTFVAQPAVEAFDVGILRGLAWLDELQLYPALFAPSGKRTSAKLRSVVHHNRLRQSALTRHPIQHTAHSQPAQRSVDFDSRTFPRAIVHDGQHPNHLPCTNPLAWLRFEPGDNLAEVRLQLWPDGEDRLLARSGFHGKPVHWLGAET